MRNAAIALSAYAVAVARGIGLEGAFLLVGTVFLAVGAGFLDPAGPWFVIGAMAVLAGLALAVPRRG